MNISFSMTPMQIINQSKDVTRRFGWDFLKVGQVLQPVLKAQGLKKGEKAQRLGGLIIVVSIRTEALNAITGEECVREGFPEFKNSPEKFVNMLVKKYRCNEAAPVKRIEFDYLLPTGACRTARCKCCVRKLIDGEKVWMRGYTHEWYNCKFSASFAKDMQDDCFWPVVDDACYNRLKAEGKL